MAVMNVDTGVETIVSDVPGMNEHRGAWSPDASRIAFHLGDKIAVVNADGTGLMRFRTRCPRVDRLVARRFVDLREVPERPEVVAIDAVRQATARSSIPLNGTEAGVFSWQRTRAVGRLEPLPGDPGPSRRGLSRPAPLNNVRVDSTKFLAVACRWTDRLVGRSPRSSRP